MTSGREFDIVLLGATGLTGALTAEYLAANAPHGCRWAIAGRNRDKLEAVRARLAEINPSCAELGILIADVTDDDSLRDVAARSRVVVTTVGPYLTYGAELVAACAAAGTDYLDLSGEPEFVDRMYLEHHATALESGVRLVHSAGFDSIPYDLGAYFTVGKLPEGVPIRLQGFVSASGTFSAGSYHSAINAFSRLRDMAKTSAARRRAEVRPKARRVRGAKGAPRFEKLVNAWVLPMPTIDPIVVLRSARALPRYGPDFSYGQYIAVRRLPVALGIVGGIGALFALAQVPPTRKWLLARKASGEGPSAEQRAKSWFRLRFVAEAGDERVLTEVSGGDPGYGETAMMLAESALCLAFDDLPPVAGQVTTAVAMGDKLLARLVRAGMVFRVVEQG